jgi:hypothetical protein
VNRYLILTHGRAGSVLIAEKIGRKFNFLPIYVKHSLEFGDFPVQHSHLIFEKDQTQKFIKVFCLRKNPIDTLLSCIFATQYQQYHKFKDQAYHFKSFTYTNWKELDQWCEHYILYHNSYENLLDEQFVVLYYEDMILQLSNVNETYLPIYPNKEKLLINYNQVLDHLTPLNDKMLLSQKWCLSVQNQINIYDILN